MQREDYNLLSRTLHRIVLGSRFISKASFNFETDLNGSGDASLSGKHLFISGLARSGTTNLLNRINSSGIYRSLTYRDMPFILMPNLWKKISGNLRKEQISHERAHGDGIEVGCDSPEAFEEVFWRTFCGPDYILADHLRPHDVNEEIIGNFRAFVHHVLKSRANGDQTRYLSKNNNNILRFPIISRSFPDSVILVPYRDPFQHASSLLRQHNKFSALHARDKFSLAYMNWLGHFEFGLNHKSFFFGDDVSRENSRQYPDGTINYWLNSWKEYYSYLIGHLPGNAWCFCFEKYCSDPGVMLSRLFSVLDIDAEPCRGDPFAPVTLPVKETDPDLLSACNSIYKKLTELRNI